MSDRKKEESDRKKKAWIDAAKRLLETSCPECDAILETCARNRWVGGEPEKRGMEVVSDASLFPLPNALKEMFAGPHPFAGFCVCGRRWTYEHAHPGHVDIGKLKFTRAPDPRAADWRREKGQREARAKKAKKEKARQARADQIAADKEATRLKALRRDRARANEAADDLKHRLRGLHPEAQVNPPPETRRWFPSGRSLRQRVASCFPHFAEEPRTLDPYFATFSHLQRPLADVLAEHRGTVIVALRRRRCPHNKKHPRGLERPEIQHLLPHALGTHSNKRADLFEIAVEYLDLPAFDGCCLRADFITVDEGALYATLGPSLTYREASGGEATPLMTPEEWQPLSRDDLHEMLTPDFADVLSDAPTPEPVDLGVFDGSLPDLVESWTLPKDDIVTLAVEWASHDWQPSHCPQGIAHPAPLQRDEVRAWIAKSSSTSGFLTRDDEPILIALPVAGFEWPAEPPCCLTTTLMHAPSKRMMRPIAPNRIAWERR